MELRQQFALDLHELYIIRLFERPFLHDLVEDDVDAMGCSGVQVQFPRFAVPVAWGGAETAIALVEIHECQDPVLSLFQFGQRLREREGVAADDELLIWLPLAHVPRQHRLWAQPIRHDRWTADFLL